MLDFVSVIIPTYNRERTLERAIRSVLGQTFTNLELIIIDDGSSDNTEALVAKLQKEDERISYFKTENKGVSAARNTGIRCARGNWLAFLDSDDEWLKGKLDKQDEYLIANPECRIVHTEEIWIRNNVRVNPHKKHKKMGGRIFSQSLELCLMSPSSILIHKSILDDVGLFNEKYPVCEDYELWLRILEKYKVGFVEMACIKKYGGHEDQLSTKYIAMDYWRLQAMKGFFDSTHLSAAEKAKLEQIYTHKYYILEQGAMKHGNKELLKQLASETIVGS